MQCDSLASQARFLNKGTVSFSFSIYLPYLESAIVTSQIIYDVTDVHHDANKPSAS